MRKLELSAGYILIAGAFLLATNWWPALLLLGVCLVGDSIVNDDES